MEMLLRFCVKLGHCKMKPLNILTSSKAEAPPLTDATGGHSLLCSSAPQPSSKLKLTLSPARLLQRKHF